MHIGACKSLLCVDGTGLALQIFLGRFVMIV